MTWVSRPVRGARPPMQSSGPITVEDLVTYWNLDDPRVSPDGSRVAFVVALATREGEHPTSSIWMVAVNGAAPARRFTVSGGADTAPRWSPDGRWLAFLSDRAES